jgi:hypothetical protein
MSLPTTIKHNPTYDGNTIPFAESEQRCHVVQERLSRHVQATSNGTTFIVGPSDVNKERAGIEEIPENIELHEQLLFLLGRRRSRRLGQASIPRWLFLGHGTAGGWK